MFSTDFIFKQENFVDNQKCQAGFRPLCNKILAPTLYQIGKGSFVASSYFCTHYLVLTQDACNGYTPYFIHRYMKHIVCT